MARPASVSKTKKIPLFGVVAIFAIAAIWAAANMSTGHFLNPFQNSAATMIGIAAIIAVVGAVVYYARAANRRLQSEKRAQEQAATSLRVAEDYNKELVDNSLATMCIHDCNGVLMTVNSAACRSLGFTRPELVRRNLRDLVPESLRQEFDVYLSRIQTNGEDSGYIQVRAKNGDVKTWAYRNKVTRKPGGRQYVIGAAHDVTEQIEARRAERHMIKQLNREKLFISTVLHTTDALVMVLNAEGSIVRFNRACERSSGYDEAEVLGQNACELFLNEENDVKARSRMQSVLQTGEPIAMECTWKARDGSLRLIRWTMTPMRVEGGEGEHVIATGTDITEAHNSEEEIKFQETCMDLLHRVTRLANESAELPQALEESTQRLCWFTGSTVGQAFMVGPDGTRRRLEFDQYRSLSEQEWLIGHESARSGADDAHRTETPTAAWAKIPPAPLATSGAVDLSLASEFIVPVTVSGKTIAIIEMFSPLPEAPRSEVLEALTQAGQVLGRVFERETAAREIESSNRKLQGKVDELSARAMEMVLLHEMTTTMQACDSVQQGFEQASYFLQQFFPGSNTGITMKSPSDGSFIVVAKAGPLHTRSTFQAVDCGALREDLAEAVPGNASLLCKHFEQEPGPGESYLCLPLVNHDGTFGSLVIESSPEAPLPSHEFMTTLTEEIALTVANLQLQEQLRYQSMHDALTGLCNRRYLETTLPRELSRARREKLATAAIMFDIDHFKRLNDTFGHQAGDEALKMIGQLVGQNTRKEDLACRYGGEEFLVVLPGMNAYQAVQKAEELRSKIEAMDLRPIAPELDHVTISVGVSMFPDEASTGDALIASADQAMYQAKSHGRNQVVSAFPLALLGPGARAHVM